jgi:limonene-1,2-epoxide hydrolase
VAAKHDGKHARANMWVTHQNLARAKSGRPFHEAKSRKGLPPPKAKPAAPQRPEVVLAPRQLVEAWVEAFNRADVAALAAFYAEDAVNHQVAESPVQGREAIREMLAAGFEAAKMVCVVENVFQDGEWAILEWRDPLGLRGCGFFHVVAGRIVLQRGYWDKLTFLRTQGLPLPTKP